MRPSFDALRKLAESRMSRVAEAGYRPAIEERLTDVVAESLAACGMRETLLTIAAAIALGPHRATVERLLDMALPVPPPALRLPPGVG